MCKSWTGSRMSSRAAVSGFRPWNWPDPKWDERPLAIVVPRPGAELTADALKAHLAKYVEEGAITRWAIPDRFVFVESLPKTSVGKIDKKVLRAQYGQAA